MANLQNLKPFPPGNNANPKGRPKGSKSISSLLNKYLKQQAPNDIKNAKMFKEYLGGKDKLTNSQAIAITLLFKSINKQDLRAIQEILDRTEGKPIQAIDHSGNLAATQPIINVIKDGESISLVVPEQREQDQANDELSAE